MIHHAVCANFRMTSKKFMSDMEIEDYWEKFTGLSEDELDIDEDEFCDSDCDPDDQPQGSDVESEPGNESDSNNVATVFDVVGDSTSNPLQVDDFSRPSTSNCNLQHNNDAISGIDATIEYVVNA